MDRFLRSTASRRASLLILRVSIAGLVFWWGLIKGLGTGTGQAVSDKFYGGAFSMDALLIGFGWAQVVLAILVAAGAYRRITLPLMFLINAFVAAAIWQSIVDPFWLWMGGDKPETVNALFYPSLIVVAGCWVLMAFRSDDRWTIGPQ